MSRRRTGAAVLARPHGGLTRRRIALTVHADEAGGMGGRLASGGERNERPLLTIVVISSADEGTACLLVLIFQVPQTPAWYQAVAPIGGMHG